MSLIKIIKNSELILIPEEHHIYIYICILTIVYCYNNIIKYNMVCEI